MTIDHLGIAVKSLDPRRASFMKTWEAQVAKEEVVAHER